MTDETQAVFRKDGRVFWVLVRDEILLRNYATNVAIQLKPDQKAVWELLDGAHSTDQIVERFVGDPNFNLHANEIRGLIASLEAGGFLTRA